MKLLPFRDYDHYHEAQRRTVRKRGGPFFTDVEFVRIGDWLKARGVTAPVRGICHGARNGLEADHLAKQFGHPDTGVVGTDLFPHSGSSAGWAGESEVVKWDFSEQKPEWVGAFDVLYSNSLDHSQDPVKTLAVWFEQLRPGGHLFLQHSRSHRAEAVRGGDCFGASVYEYMGLLDDAGKMEDVLYVRVKYERKMCRRRANEELILAASKGKA